MSRESRKISRYAVSESVPIVMSIGEKRCVGSLVDLTPNVSCAFRVGGVEFDSWTIEDLKEVFSVKLRGEIRPVRLVRISRTRKTLAGGWVIGVVFV